MKFGSLPHQFRRLALRRGLIALLISIIANTVATLAGAGPLLGVNSLAWIGHLDLRLFQDRLATAPLTASPDIVIVGIDEETPRRMGFDPALGRLPRQVHGALLDRLRSAGASIVLIDLLFTQPGAPEEDAEFRRALQHSAPLAVVLVTEYERNGSFADPDAPTGWRYRFRPVQVLPDPLPENVTVTSAIAWDPANVLSGAVLLRPDEATRQWMPHAALAASLGRFHILPREARWLPEENLVLASPLAWCVGADGEIVTRYAARETSFKRLEYTDAWQLLNSNEGAPLFRNKIVIVGDFSGNDTHPTPQGRMDGPEFLAHTINTLLQPSPSQVASWNLPLNFAWGTFLAFGAAFVILSLNWRAAFAGVAAVFALLIIIPAALIHVGHIWLFTVVPGLALLATILLSGIVALAISGQNLPQHIRRGRPRQLTEEATVLFIDLMESTQIVERLGAETAGGLQALLLKKLAAVVAQHGGEVERTLGDGMLVLFRAGETVHHALRAASAARSILEELVPLSSDWEAKHGVRAMVTMGLETGIISGTVLQVGVEEWSSSGRAVNQASRLQSACGSMGVQVLLGPGICAMVRDTIPLRSVGILNLKGIAEPVSTYTFADAAPEDQR